MELIKLGKSTGHRAVIFPTRDDDVVFLDRFRAELEPHFILTIPASAAVSACLAGRTNYYGTVVMISLRGGSEALTPSASEAATYTWEEGAFWGNLFASTPALYACHVPAHDAHSRGAS